MGNALIREHVGIARRYMRSTDLLRDIRSPAALEGYIVTPSARDCIERIVSGLAPGSTQRAFRVTGPYGSGKSSLGLLLASLFDADTSSKAWGLISKHVSFQRKAIPRYRSIALVGRRASLADDLLSATIGLSSTLRWAAKATSSMRQLANRRLSGKRDIADVLSAVGDFAQAYAVKEGMGLLVLIDEMGRYLEYSAANPDLEDPSIFQQLAERASGSGMLAVVAFLHHRFSDYVAGLGAWVEGEWARSAERYEELVFHESTEQTLFLLGHALVASKPVSARVSQAAKSKYKEAVGRSVFTTQLPALLEIAPSLYPLHPATVACLATAARRFGQNERSVFSFLQSLEPHGLQRYLDLANYGQDEWYRIDRLFDYCAGQSGLRFRSTDRERRWQLAQDAVALTDTGNRLQTATLKALAMISVLEPIPGLPLDAASIAWALDEPVDATQTSLTALVKLGVVHRRPNRGDYSLWSNSSVDLDWWFEEAKLRVPPPSRIDSIALPIGRPVVAHRHYHRTGTLRTFAVGMAGTQSDETDGSISIVAVHPQETLQEVRKKTLIQSKAAGELRLFCLRSISPAHLACAHDLSLWQWVLENCADLRIDDLAREEVNRRIAMAQNELRSLMAPFARPGEDAGSAVWAHNGSEVRIQSRGDLSRYLSDLCDRVFHASPILKNELINRGRLSSAIAAARMRLMNLMIGASDIEYLGLTGAPPERTIYLSLFQESGLHSLRGAQLGFGPPPDDDPMSWRQVWNHIDTLVTTSTSLRLDDLISRLATPPFGLRSGPALLVIAAYLVFRRADVALMERNTFQPEITGAHFMRLAKSPSNFAMRRLETKGSSRDLIARVAELPFWQSIGRAPEVALKPVMHALFTWFNGLSEYSQSTTALGPFTANIRAALRKSSEPITLLSEDLPAACGAIVDGTLDVESYLERLNDSLLELEGTTSVLRQRVEMIVLDAFEERSLEDVRRRISSDFKKRVLQLRDYRMRGFVERSLGGSAEADGWLDSVASVTIGRRMAAWDDLTLDKFAFELRGLAQQLNRWLALSREAEDGGAPISGLFLTQPSGEEVALYVRESGNAAKTKGVLAKVRKVLGEIDDPDQVLLELVKERAARIVRQKAD